MAFQLYVQPRQGEYMLDAVNTILEQKKKREEENVQMGKADSIMDYGRKIGSVSEDQWLKYQGLNAKQKIGMADEISRNTLSDIAEKHFQQEQAFKQQELGQRMAIARMQADIASGKIAPPLQQVTVTDAEGNDVSFLRAGTNIQRVEKERTPIYPEIPEIDPNTGKQIGVRIGNQPHFYPTPDPYKQAIANLMTGGAGTTAAPAAAPGTDTGALSGILPKSWDDFLRYGPQGPPPAPAPTPAPVLTPTPSPGLTDLGGGGFDAGAYFESLANRPLAARPEFSRSLRPAGGITMPQITVTAPASVTGTAAIGGRTPPQSAIDALKQNPSAARKREFDIYYGPGSAAAVLGE